MLNCNSVGTVVAGMAILFSAAFNGNVLGARWIAGDVVTYSQGAWSAHPAAVILLDGNYTSVYSTSLGIVEVGIPGAAGLSTLFSSPSSVFNYLPALGPAGPLNADLIDPTSTASGQFGGDVLALTINIDFSDFGVTRGTLGIPFGDLQLHSFIHSQINLNGLSVRQLLGHANNLLGGGSSLFYSIPQLGGVTAELNSSFGGGGVSVFAEDHLRVVPGMSGDYNANGIVDAADYAVWRGRLGATTAMRNDPIGGTIGPAQYAQWRANFGKTLGFGATAGLPSSADAVVPEPAGAGLALLALMALVCVPSRLKNPC